VSGDQQLVGVFNFTPVPREDFRLGVPAAGHYREILNSDSAFYGGSDVGNGGVIETDSLSWMGRPDSVRITLPPLAGLLLRAEATGAG
jgi:1,4-alpha-glucan branching enzyme